MQHISTRIRLGGALLLLCLTAPAALADQVTVTMRIVSWPLTLTNWAGENISPYSAQIKTGGNWTNPKPIDLSVVCLDIAETVGVNDNGRLYTVTPNTGDTFDPILRPDPLSQKRYDGAARLAAELFATPTPSGYERGRLSFAIWYIFNPTALTHPGVTQSTLDLTGVDGFTHRAAIIAKANAAINSTTSVYYNVYTPAATGTNLSSQRFIGNVSVPEPSAVALLALDMSGLLGLVVVLRRRFRRPE